MKQRRGLRRVFAVCMTVCMLVSLCAGIVSAKEETMAAPEKQTENLTPDKGQEEEKTEGNEGNLLPGKEQTEDGTILPTQGQEEGSVTEGEEKTPAQEKNQTETEPSEGLQAEIFDMLNDAEPTEDRDPSGEGLNVEGGIKDTDYTYQDGVLTILTETPMKISNLNTNNATTDRIEVALKDVSGTANLTLATVLINVQDIEDAAAISVSKGRLCITLAERSQNALISSQNCAGIQNNENPLTIQCVHANETRHICDEHCGTLGAMSAAYGAGIGGGKNGNGSNITISGGVVVGMSRGESAGIGGGSHGNASKITISGGLVNGNAEGGEGCGIGGGKDGSADNIRIAPPKDVQIMAAVGNTLDDVKVLSASPFKSETEVSDWVQGYKVFVSDASIMPGTGFQVEGGSVGTDYTYAEGELTILTETPLRISMAPGVTDTTDHIKVDLQDEEKTADLTLGGVNISMGYDNSAAAMQVVSGQLKLTLADDSENSLKSGAGFAGLHNGEHKLLLRCEGAEKDGHVCNASCGELIATGNEGAGIGGGSGSENGCNGCHITITGGRIQASGEGVGAGIGGGKHGEGNDIRIAGGRVTATGGYYSGAGAGIGGGYRGNADSIIISGGMVEAKTGSSGSAAGIGGGSQGSASNITISGGIIKAKGDTRFGAGIGGGLNGSAKNITIAGGMVEAEGGRSSAGIGGGYNGESSNIFIDASADMPIIALAGANADSAAALDGSPFTERTEITESVKGKQYVHSDVNAGYQVDGGEEGTDYTYDENGALIIRTETPMRISYVAGGSMSRSLTADVFATQPIEVKVPETQTANLILAGVRINTEQEGVAALKVTSGGLNLTLADGTINTLQPGEDCAGLQNGKHELLIQCEKAGTKGHICDANCGMLNAVGNYGAGIGGGNGESGGNITIAGGKVTANGGNWSAGIGGGSEEKGENILISGGIIEAAGMDGGAGIGGGNDGGVGKNITITGGMVKAKAGKGGTAIGGGDENGSGSNINISGGLYGEGDVSANTVYGITPADGYLVRANTDVDTLAEYPVGVYAKSKPSPEPVPEPGPAPGSGSDTNTGTKPGNNVGSGKGAGAVATGDRGTPFLWLTLAGISAVGVITLIYRRRKSKKAA